MDFSVFPKHTTHFNQTLEYSRSKAILSCYNYRKRHKITDSLYVNTLIMRITSMGNKIYQKWNFRKYSLMGPLKLYINLNIEHNWKGKYPPIISSTQNYTSKPNLRKAGQPPKKKPKVRNKQKQRDHKMDQIWRKPTEKDWWFLRLDCMNGAMLTFF